MFYSQAGAECSLCAPRVALAIREKTGKPVIKRAELIRAIVDHAAAWVRPDKPDADFDKAVRSLLPSLEGKDT